MYDWAEQTARARALGGAFDLPQGVGLTGAYALQDSYTGHVASRRGGVAGFKLAVNGAAQMAHFGVSEPVWARVFAQEVYPSGTTLARADFGQLVIEPELLAVLGPEVATLAGPVTRDAALACIARFHAAFELIDQRGFSVPMLELSQAVALNVFNAGAVVGEASVPARALDPAELSVTLRLDGAVAAETTGTAPQDPVEAVRWLLDQLVTRGVALRDGMIVLCGTHLPMRVVAPETRAIAVEMTGLGTVSFTLT